MDDKIKSDFNIRPHGWVLGRGYMPTREELNMEKVRTTAEILYLKAKRRRMEEANRIQVYNLTKKLETLESELMKKGAEADFDDGQDDGRSEKSKKEDAEAVHRAQGFLDETLEEMKANPTKEKINWQPRTIPEPFWYSEELNENGRPTDNVTTFLIKAPIEGMESFRSLGHTELARIEKDAFGRYVAKIRWETASIPYMYKEKKAAMEFVKEEWDIVKDRVMAGGKI